MADHLSGDEETQRVDIEKIERRTVPHFSQWISTG
jgi:hypothetical protein